ncbi:PAS domain-containing protein [Billgrantia endophytica]|uniref:histidine kinase n=1 Tax=Billgrantia endophytica TaxID=2033802 RepID=A0A2N7TWN6_9GAMM|nr:PAS domain-containing protein [Halomonas endophytica]PMR72592.1 hypothetical protein C1H69_20315 [Halomonas endophytica]
MSLSYETLHLRRVERYAPPSILVSPEHKVVHFSKHAGRFLGHPGEGAAASVFKLVREELRLGLRAVLVAAEQEARPIRSTPIAIDLEGEPCNIVIHARPPEEWEDQGLTLVIFEEHESSQEAMRAANEELQSANEALRSTMAELQSMNEGFATASRENRHRIEELDQFSSDMQNLLAATEITTICLDVDLRILRFTPLVGALFNIRPADRGRPLSELAHRLGYDQLTSDARRVLEKPSPLDREVQDIEGNWFLTRVRPYRNSTDHIDGVVITFIDITEHKRFEVELRESEERFRVLVDASAQIVWQTDAKGEFTKHCSSWQAYTGQTYEQLKGHGWANAVSPDSRAEALATWQQAVDTGRPLQIKLQIYHAKSGQYRWTAVRANALRNTDDTIRGWVGMNIDINEQKLAEQALTELNETLEARVRERTAQVSDLAWKLTMAEQEERRRVSQVLHDDLQQLLYGLQIKLCLIQERLAATGQHELTDVVEGTRLWIKQAIETTRQLTVDLSPPILKTEGLAEALEWLQRQMQQMHELDVGMTIHHPPHMPDEDLRVLLFQIVRELLFNVKKHSHVDKAAVELDQTEEEIIIQVSDAGEGFDLALMEAGQDEHPGFGLVSSRERLRLLGGSMEIDTVPRSGTSIVIRVPARPEWLRKH